MYTYNIRDRKSESYRTAVILRQTHIPSCHQPRNYQPTGSHHLAGQLVVLPCLSLPRCVPCRRCTAIAKCDFGADTNYMISKNCCQLLAHFQRNLRHVHVCLWSTDHSFLVVLSHLLADVHIYIHMKYSVYVCSFDLFFISLPLWTNCGTLTKIFA